MIRQDLQTLKGKTIAAVIHGGRGDYIFMDKRGVILFTVSTEGLFDVEGNYFDDSTTD